MVKQRKLEVTREDKAEINKQTAGRRLIHLLSLRFTIKGKSFLPELLSARSTTLRVLANFSASHSPCRLSPCPGTCSMISHPWLFLPAPHCSFSSSVRCSFQDISSLLHHPAFLTLPRFRVPQEKVQCGPWSSNLPSCSLSGADIRLWKISKKKKPAFHIVAKHRVRSVHDPSLRIISAEKKH